MTAQTTPTVNGVCVSVTQDILNYGVSAMNQMTQSQVSQDQLWT